MRSFGIRLKHWFSLIRFSHTVFALPFAFIGFFLAIEDGGTWNIKKFLLVLGCMVSARTSAMAFNRFADRYWDALNVRTKNREIPRGIISPSAALWLSVISAMLFVYFAFLINRLCFYLSPVALMIILGYSYTKRFTSACHLILGLGLALAPVGAYLAVRESFALLPVLFGAIVLCWVSGFDIIYALPDAEFDRQHGLFSIPAVLGIKKALLLSELLHALAFIILFIISFMYSWNIFFFTGAIIFSLLMFYQHLLVKPNDFSKINLAFGTLNGWASVIFGIFVCADLICW
jgi:4-hydroxybenzoate polyprenyltransferase